MRRGRGQLLWGEMDRWWRVYWVMFTGGSAPLLPKDWYMCEIEWVVFKRGYWKVELLNVNRGSRVLDMNIEDEDDENASIAA